MASKRLTADERDREMPYIGYARLRPGRIHFYCPSCGRKQSNMPRDKYDPKRAVLMIHGCEKCDSGCKDYAPLYRSADGSTIPWDEDEVKEASRGK